MFELNDAISENEEDQAPEWRQLFVEAISDYVLADETSPNVVDAEEAAWLIEKVSGDGELDVTEQELLKAIQNRAESIDQSLTDFINQYMPQA